MRISSILYAGLVVLFAFGMSATVNAADKDKCDKVVDSFLKEEAKLKDKIEKLGEEYQKELDKGHKDMTCKELQDKLQAELNAKVDKLNYQMKIKGLNLQKKCPGEKKLNHKDVAAPKLKCGKK